MIFPKFALAAAALAALFMVASPAEARRHHHWRHYGLPYPISYQHNYGPGLEPGTFAYYDGPSRNLCYQGAAAYRAQGGRYPCF